MAEMMTRLCCEDGGGSRAALLALIVGAATLAPAATRADDQQAAVEEFRTGKQAYLEGRYEDAIRSYEKALALKYSAKLHYNIGLACEKLAQLAKARAAYARYLKEEPAASNADEVRQRIVELEQRIKDEKRAPPRPQPASRPRGGDRTALVALAAASYGPPVTIDVMSRPPAAEIFLNGQLIGVTPLRVNMAAGATYRVSAERRGYLAATRSYTVRDRDLLQLDLELSPQGRLASMTRTEWFGLEPMIGGGAGGRLPSFGLNLQTIGLRWRYFAWTVVELGLAAGGMYLVGLGTRPGFPIYLGARGQHQLRVGLGFSIGFMKSMDQDSPASTSHYQIGGTGLVLSPSLEYRCQTEKSFYWGFALRPYLMAAGSLNTDYATGRPLPWVVMLGTSLGWSARAY
jgi:hypothetical protein